MRDPLSNERLTEISDRMEAATPGNWGVGNGTSIALDVKQISSGHCRWTVKLAEVTDDYEREDYAAETGIDVAHAEDDALFIAHARRDVEDLLHEVDRFRRGMRDLYARWVQRARDNGDYYNRMGAKYELGKAVAFDAAAEEIRLLMGEEVSADA